MEGEGEGMLAGDEGGMVRYLYYGILVVYRLRSGVRDGKSWFIVCCLLFIPRCAVQRLH